MINNIINVEAAMPQINTSKTTTSMNGSVQMPPLLSFKKPFFKEKAELRVKKFKRSEGIIIAGDIDDNYVDLVDDTSGEEESGQENNPRNFFMTSPQKKEKKKVKVLKDCYIIDYIQSPKVRCGMGTNAIKALAEKAKFDPNIDGRIVTYSAPVWKESSPALFFYKLGFRFMEKQANDYMQECLIKKTPDIPAQTGMMYLPAANLHKLLRYGELY